MPAPGYMAPECRLSTAGAVECRGTLTTKDASRATGTIFNLPDGGLLCSFGCFPALCLLPCLLPCLLAGLRPTTQQKAFVGLQLNDGGLTWRVDIRATGEVRCP